MIYGGPTTSWESTRPKNSPYYLVPKWQVERGRPQMGVEMAQNTENLFANKSSTRQQKLRSLDKCFEVLKLI